MTMSAPTQTARRDELADRLFGAAVGALELLNVYVGDRLGLYRELAASGPLTSAELSTAAGVAERYAREWLEQQAVAGILDVIDGTDAASRRYRIDAAVEQVVVDADQLTFLAPLASGVVGAARTIPAVLDAFRSGGGVPYAAFGDEFRRAIADLNRPMYLHQLGREWLPAMPDINRRLRADPPACVLDVGCGCGWSTIAIAEAYPRVDVVGVDTDAASIAEARVNAARADVEWRTQFLVAGADGAGAAGPFDLATAFECVHDMADPIGVLRRVREQLAPGGTMLIGDERVEDEFTAPSSAIERFNYGWSTVHCLPAGMADRPSVGTGTVMRPATLRGYAMAAGFTRFEVLDIEHDFWNFYRLGV
jgi:2-polyprenyl-3-methyl-5-hydroxy-6-metoxy-1,4-benzoquinol methylase